MKVAASASVTTLLALLVVSLLTLSLTANAACCYVGCSTPRCNPCRTASACGPKGSCASSSCHATRNILVGETFSLADEASAVAEPRHAKLTDDLTKESRVEIFLKKDDVKDRLPERATKHNPKPNPAGACCKTNCNTIGCTKCAHVLGNTCSHGSCNANECSGASAEDELLDPVSVREEKHHKAVLEEHPGKRKRFDDGLSTDHDEGSKTKRSVQHE